MLQADKLKKQQQKKIKKTSSRFQKRMKRKLGLKNVKGLKSTNGQL